MKLQAPVLCGSLEFIIRNSMQMEIQISRQVIISGGQIWARLFKTNDVVS